MTTAQHFFKLFSLGWLLGCCMAVAEGARADGRPDISKDLKGGHLAAAQEALTKHLSTNRQDDLARFQLGSVEFFAAIEGLAQDSYRYGLRPTGALVPFLRTPIKENPNPEAITYDDARKMIERFVAQVEHAEATLSPIKDSNLSWDLDLTAVRLDMNGDGEADPDETLWSIFRQFTQRGPEAAATPESFPVGLDSADVHWLRGYCHLLAALGDMILAYDHQRLFDYTAQLFFAKPETPFAAVLIRQDSSDVPTSPWDQEGIMDAIAFIHLANFSVRDPELLGEARDHLLAMIQSSRKSWELIEAETDNNHEWIPGPHQKSVVEGVTINKEQVAAWRRFLDEADDVLNGKKLVPFWRGSSGKGVNLMKVFTEPKDFDLVLWVQGSGAVPYLETGEVTSPETWAGFQRAFRGNFIGMAIWIN
jgi:hypothetical protein